jgi:hypothetical protein
MAGGIIESGIQSRLAGATVFRRNGSIHANSDFDIRMGFREVDYYLVEAHLFIVP